jgi:hypothetical protein
LTLNESGYKMFRRPSELEFWNGEAESQAANSTVCSEDWNGGAGDYFLTTGGSVSIAKEDSDYTATAKAEANAALAAAVDGDGGVNRGSRDSAGGNFRMRRKGSSLSDAAAFFNALGEMEEINESPPGLAGPDYFLATTDTPGHTDTAYAYAAGPEYFLAEADVPPAQVSTPAAAARPLMLRRGSVDEPRGRHQGRLVAENSRERGLSYDKKRRESIGSSVKPKQRVSSSSLTGLDTSLTGFDSSSSLPGFAVPPHWIDHAGEEYVPHMASVTSL